MPTPLGHFAAKPVSDSFFAAPTIIGVLGTVRELRDIELRQSRAIKFHEKALRSECDDERRETEARRFKIHALKVCKAHSRSLRRVGACAKRGSLAGVREASNRLLTSFSSRASAVIRVAHKGKRPLTWEEVEDMAAKLDVSVAHHEPVHARIIAKARGGHRALLRPGHRRRAEQLLLRDTMRGATIGSEYEFSRVGLGPLRLASQLAEYLHGGYRFWLVADVENCFSSVNPNHLCGMPLKSSYLRNGCFLQNGVPVLSMDSGHHDLIRVARLGLPQGSLVSPQIASAVLGRCIRSLPGDYDYKAVTVFDDIAIGARNLGEIDAIEKDLVRTLLQLPAGPLTLRHRRVYDAHDHFEFLHFKFKWRWWHDELRLVRSPSGRAFRRLAARVSDRMASGEPDEAILAYSRRWARSVGWHNQDMDEIRRELAEGILEMSVMEMLGWT